MRKITVILDNELYAAIREEAARCQRPIPDIAAEALREWLEEQEDAALRPEIEAARKEWEEKGCMEAEEFFRRLRAEERSDKRGRGLSG